MLGTFKNFNDCQHSLIESGFNRAEMVTNALESGQTGFIRKNQYINPLTGRYLDIAIIQEYKDSSCSILFG